MRNQKSVASKKSRTIREAVRLALCFALLCQCLLPFAANSNAVRAQTLSRKSATTTPPAQQTAAPDTSVSSKHIAPVSVTVVNFEELAVKAAKAARTKAGMRSAPAVLRAMPLPMTINDSPAGTEIAPGGNDVAAPAPPSQDDTTGGPNVASPSPAQSFLAQEDGPKIGGAQAGFFNIPPDTNGAVGLDKVFTNTNSNYRIHNKATGAALSTVSSDSFWNTTNDPTKGSGFFDPQIQYDPYNDRWVLAITSNAQTASSSIEVAVSQTSDPQGSYFMFRFIVGCAAGAAGCNAGGEWADFPMLGFNKNWVAVSVNMFSITAITGQPANSSVNFKTLVLDYPTLRTGTANGTLFGGGAIGFCNHPVTTYSPTENTLYFVRHRSSAGALYGVSTITGTPTTPSFTIGADKTRPGGGWTQPGGDILPQNCVAGSPVATFQCPAPLRFMDSGDAFIRSNPTYRNGQLYYGQTIGLPAGGTLTHTAAQWTVVDAVSANVVDGGRVDDPTATNANGGKWYAYPSVTANKNGDILMGFSQFASNQFASSGYTFRLAGDAAGTMRDPLIYKAGEDYYSKTFGGTRNRWGDYSHTMIDPSNDRDLWTIQEYAQQRVGSAGTTPPLNGLGSNDSRWGTYWAKVVAPAGGNDLLISEFRLQGPGGTNDEFIEIYNNNNSALTVNTLDGSAGYAVVSASNTTLNDGTPTVRCTIPSGTVIPGRGHYLCTNSVGYSLASYPAGVGTTATGDATYATDIPFNDGLAIFNTATPANFSTTTRLDAVGSSSVTNTLYREGAGYAPLTGGASANIEHSLYRDLCGKGGSPTQLGGCPTLGFPRDTNNNAVDILLADTNGTFTGGQQRLGAPGPENLSSPIQRNDKFAGPNLDSTVATSSPPNRERGFFFDTVNNSTFGTLDIRKRIVNNTGSPVTRLRFRIIDISTFPSASTPGFADLRARTSTAVVVSGINDAGTCGAAPKPCTVTVQGTTLETPPAQPKGGAFNSTLSVGTVVLTPPLAPGASINVRFLLGIEATGTFKFFVNVEALP